jgi:NTE family protein
MGKRKVGLALSGGAARGLAHVGVLAVLEKEGIPIDMIAGTSMGAIIGAFYAQGKDISQIKNAVTGLSRRKIMSLVDLTLPRTGFIKGKRVKGWLKSIIGDVNFEDLKIPLACVATDISSGEEVVIKQGSVVEAVRASVSMPVIFTPAKWQGRYLVDGGLVDPVPVSILKEIGADFTIAVNVNPYIANKSQGNKKQNLKAPNIFNIMARTLNIMNYQAAMSGLQQADVTITPNVGHINPGNFHRARECILRGHRAARRAIPEIKRRLEA